MEKLNFATTPQTSSTYVNAAGVVLKSEQQQYSMFTLSALFKAGNSTKLHGWRQEIKGKDLLTDQRNSFERLKLLATTCKCEREPKNCFLCNSTVINIYCNLIDKSVFKLVHGNLKAFSDMNFQYAQSGSIYLVAVNEVNVLKLSLSHSKLNRIYFNTSKYNG